jgi:hypothetical protein
MPSSFNWVDFAEDDRHRMMEILHLFHEKEIREELGIGTVRDAFSDILFPGTSTLHTRVKYFLFIPWIFLKHEEKKTRSDKIEEYSRYDEIGLIRALIRSKEDDGVIGKVAGSSLKILPSYMYWSGLGIWGIRRFDGTLYQYFKSLDSFYYYKKNIVKSDDKEIISAIPYNWDQNLPPRPNNFPDAVKLSLSHQEADYLRERIVTNCRESLLAFLVDKTEQTDVDYIWMHPQNAEFSEIHKYQIQHANNFSLVMNGASLLYNIMLSENKNNEEWINKYKNKISDWTNDIKNQMSQIQNWEMNEFWRIVFEQNSHIHFMTRRFIENWIDFVRNEQNLERLQENDYARHMVTRRETQIKGKRSRLKNPRMLEQWLGESGANPLDFRWRVVRRLVNDILSGLETKKD